MKITPVKIFNHPKINFKAKEITNPYAAGRVEYARRKNLSQEELNSLAQNAQTQTDEIYQKSGTVYEYMQDIYNSLVEDFMQGDKIAPDGTIVRKITYSVPGVAKMLEFSEDGEELLSITDFRDGEPYEYKEKPTHNGDCKKASIILKFYQGKPASCVQDIETHRDGTRRYKRLFNFIDEKTFSYNEDFSKKPPEKCNYGEPAEKRAKYIQFVNGKPELYVQNTRKVHPFAPKHEFTTIFKNGEVCIISTQNDEKYQITPNGWKRLEK